jgi:branched-chain amino acid transport system substrate-binding protein
MQAGIVIVVVVVAIIAGAYLAMPPPPPAVGPTVTAVAPTTVTQVVTMVQQPPIKVGVPVPLTGPFAAQAKYLKDGIVMAAEDVNNAGGLLGRKVELVFGDYEGKVDVGVSVFEKFVTQDRVDFIVGGVKTFVALATMDVAAKYGIPVVYSIPAGDSLGQKVLSDPQKYRNVYFADLNNTYWGELEVIWLKDILANNQWKPRNHKFALIAEDSDWGRGVCDIWKEELTAMGWQLVDYELVDMGQVDYTAVLAKIKALDPVLIKSEITSAEAGVALTKQKVELDIKAMFFTGYAGEVKDYDTLAGAFADYNIYYSYPLPMRWVNDLLKRFPDSDPIGAFWGYDSFMLAVDAVKRAGSTNWDAIGQALAKTDYKGLWGRWVFGSSHFPLYGAEYLAAGMLQFMGGKKFFIWPPRLKTQESNLPFMDFKVPPGTE